MRKEIAGRVEELKGQLPQMLDNALERAQDETVRKHIKKTRANHPGIDPAKTLTRLEWEYRLATAAMGGASGAAAFVPGVGTVAALPINIGEVGTFLTASTLFVLTSAEIHGLNELDPLQRRALVLGVLLGNSGQQAIVKVIPKVANHWAKQIVVATPLPALKAINKVLGPNFITKFGTKQGVLVLGRDLPVGIGAVIGTASNAAFAEGIVRSARRAFGPPPANWPDPAPTAVVSG